MRIILYSVLSLYLIVTCEGKGISKRQSIKCPTNCKTVEASVTCNITNGHCDSGCRDGYHGARCDLSCENCSDGICDQKTGGCENGCTKGYGGPLCKVTCMVNCVNCSDRSSCNVCTDGFARSAQKCIPKSIHSTTPVPVQSRGLSKVFVDAAVGISFGVMLLILVAFAVAYTNSKKLREYFKPKTDKIKEKEMELAYIQDMSGSLIRK